MPGFAPRIAFSGALAAASERERFWPTAEEHAVTCWQPEAGDALFLGGADWEYVFRNDLERLDNPRIALVQGIPPRGPEQYRHLNQRAIRICVSPQVVEAVAETGRANGPVLMIPNGIDVEPFEADAQGTPVGYESRPVPVAIVGYKNPEAARGLSEALHAARIEHHLAIDFLDRALFLDLLSRCRVAVCLPLVEEGFYLVALEAMASGCTVVTLDGIGNRSFCRHADNCLIALNTPGSLLEMTKTALQMSTQERGRLHRRALSTAVDHSLGAERTRFHEVLQDIDRLWA